MAYNVPGSSTDVQGGSTRRENGLTLTDQPFFLALSSSTLEDATKLWDALAVGAIVLEPLAASGWSAGFGMLTDAFRVTWVLDVQDASSHV